MSNVLVEKQKIDILANAISNKSGEPLTLTLDEMVEAVDGIKTEANLQEKQYSVNKAGQELIQADSGYDGLSNVIVNVPMGNAIGPTSQYSTSNYGFNYVSSTNKSLIVYGYSIPTTPTVTAGYIGSSPSSSRTVRINTNEVYNPTITVSGDTVTVPRGYYSAQVNKSVASGTAGTPTATKGTVSNNSITVTPSVTNTTGYITGSTITGTAVTVSASELVNGTFYVTQNGTADVTNYASVNVNVPSSGEDVPVFTIDLTSNPPTVTCNKTFAECEAYIANNKMIAIAYAPSASMTLSMTVYNYVENSMIYYVVYNTAGYPFADITWAIDNQPVYYEPSNLKGNLPTNATSYSTGAIQATIASSTSTQYLNIPSGYYPQDKYYKLSAMPAGTLGTPLATKGTVSNHSVSVTPSVTNVTGYIVGGTVNGTAVSVSASELVSGTLNVTSAGTKDVTNYASASIPSGTEGTPTATKGTVSNHSVSVTPSVTNTNGFINGSTKTGTAVTVSASELVSGSETKTANGTYNVTNLASLVVNVPSGENGDNLYYGSVDLTGTSWTFNNAPANLPEEETEFLHINLTAKNLNSSRLNSYNSLDFVDNQSNTMIIYGGTIAYDAGTWYEDKTINITGGTDATSKELYNILKANATQTA